MKRVFIVLILYVALAVAITAPVGAAEQTKDFDKVPLKGMVTMIDLGAKSCVPCKLMAPILERVDRNYKGKAAIVFIDVWKHREQAERFGIRAIPTQIFFDAEGKEVHRHQGFMAEEDIVEQLEVMGINKVEETDV